MPQTDEETGTTDKHWTLDRKVPLTLVVLILAQTFGFGWWGSSMSARVDALEMAQKEAKIVAAPQGDRLTRVEVDISYIKESLTEIKQLLRRAP